MNIGLIAVDEAVRDYEEAVIGMVSAELEKEGIRITHDPCRFIYKGPQSVLRLLEEATAKSDRLILITDIVAGGSEAFSEAVDAIGKRRIWPIILITHIEDEEVMKDKTPWFATTVTSKGISLPFRPYLPSYSIFSINFRTGQIYDEVQERMEADWDKGTVYLYGIMTAVMIL